MKSWLKCCLPLCAVAILAGCMTRGMPQGGEGEQPAARALLLKSAEAHGLDAFRRIDDISVGYAGEWHGLVRRLQPVLVDAGFRQGSQERIVLRGEPAIALQHAGPRGSKQVIRAGGRVQVFYDGVASDDPEVLAAAALVADGYRMFLTAPFHFLEGNVSLALAGSEEVAGRPCTTLLAVRRPGHGNSAEDRYLLFIDREDHRLRRIRFTMEGLVSTQGAVAEVDFLEHREVAGVLWPTRFHERLRKPIPNLPVHDWRVTGLDINRGLDAADLSGPAFSPKAAAPARPLAPSAQPAAE